jgi:hypothetical protein
MSKGYTAQSFKGIPIAIEWHADGSVTICKELVEHIRNTGDTAYLIPPPPGTVHVLDDDFLGGSA